MKRHYLFIIAILLVWNGIARAENPRFVRKNSFSTCADIDQNFLVNYVVIGDVLFYIHSFYSAHQERGWMTIWPIEIEKPTDSSSFSFSPDYIRYEKPRFIGYDCYRALYIYPESMGYQIIHYRIAGLEGVSSIENSAWELFQ